MQKKTLNITCQKEEGGEMRGSVYIHKSRVLCAKRKGVTSAICKQLPRLCWARQRGFPLVGRRRTGDAGSVG